MHPKIHARVQEQVPVPMPAFSMVVLDMDEKVSANVKEQSHF